MRLLVNGVNVVVDTVCYDDELNYTYSVVKLDEDFVSMVIQYPSLNQYEEFIFDLDTVDNIVTSLSCNLQVVDSIINGEVVVLSRDFPTRIHVSSSRGIAIVD